MAVLTVDRGEGGQEASGALMMWQSVDKPVLAGLGEEHSNLMDTTRSRHVRCTTHLKTHKLTTHSTRNSDEYALTQNPKLHRLASSTARNTPHPISL